MGLKFKAPGAEVTVQLFEEPVRDDAQTDEEWLEACSEWASRKDVSVVVRLVNRSTFRRWAYSHDKIRADNRVAIRELRKKMEPSDNPSLYSDTVILEVAADASDALMREVVSAAIVELRGVEVEGYKSEAYRDPKLLPDLVEHCGLLTHVFAAALRAQNPGRVEVFS